MLDNLPDEVIADAELSVQSERVRFHLSRVLEAYKSGLSNDKLKDGKEYLTMVENVLIDAYEALTGESI